MDADLLRQLVDLLEEKVIENRALYSALKRMEKQAPYLNVEQLVASAKKTPEIVDAVCPIFSQLRDQLASEQNQEEALKEFLRVAPTTKRVN